MEVKIVGAVADENTLEEIENIAKVFIYEQRMKSFTAHLTIPHSSTKQRMKADLIIEHKRRITPEYPAHILVKGLC